MKTRVVKRLIILFSIILFLLLLFLIAIEVGEKQLVKQINSSQQIKVSSVNVNLLHAIVVVHDFSLKQQDISMESKEIVLDVSFNEILDLVFTKEKELSTAYITLANTHIVYDDIVIAFSLLQANVEGKVSLINMNDAHLYSLDVVASDFSYTQLEDNFKCKRR